MRYLFVLFSISLLTALIGLGGCATPKADLYPPGSGGQKKATIHVSRLGWHTGILVKKQMVDTLLPALVADFPDATYLNISWGDRKYFMAPEGTVGLALRAALLPTRSVIHVDGYSRLPGWYFESNQVAEIKLSRKGFRSMIGYIRSGFSRDSTGKLIPLRETPETMSYFYLSDITYWGTRTCNVWTARAIRKAGFPILPFVALTAGNVMNQIRRNR